MKKNYKIRKDLSIVVNGHTLFRIEAIKDIAIHNVSKGEVGGYIEFETNLYDNAWVFDDATVYGEATVCGEAIVRGEATVCEEATVCGDATVCGKATVCGEAIVCGEATVYGDRIRNNKEIYNICCNDTYNITILPNFIKIGCQFHKKEEWWKFTNREIEAMDGLKAIRFWKKWKPILQAICGENK